MPSKRRRVYDLCNTPWIHGPRWWRAHRYSKTRSRQMDAEHIAWAESLAAASRPQAGAK